MGGLILPERRRAPGLGIAPVDAHISAMTQNASGLAPFAVAALMAAIPATPVSAQTGGQPLFPTPEEMEEFTGALRGALEDLAERSEPMLRRFELLLEDPDAYEAPEVLPNGDIILRRKTPLTPEDEPPGTNT